MRDAGAEINRYAIVYFHLCFLSTILHALTRIIFNGTGKSQYDRKVIEGPFECKLVFCKSCARAYEA